MTMSEDPVRAAVGQQAADWFVTNQDEAAARRSAREFMAWLRTSPLHVEEYLCVAAIAHDFHGATAAAQRSIEDLVAEARADRGPVATIGRVEPSPARRSWSRRWVPVSVGAMCAGVLAALIVGSHLPRTPATPPLLLSTTHGERHSFTLADGSGVELNSDTTVRVRFTGAERLVEVDRGQAFFHVAKDAARRFRVAAGGADVVAIGTQFDVRRRSDSAVVAVVEGHVAVYAATSRGDATVAISGSAPVHLHGGEMIAVRGAVAANQVESFDARQVEAWRSGQIVFEERPLAEVAAEFNQYSNRPIAVLDPSLGAMRISGAFAAGDLDSFVAFVGSLDAVRVTRTAARIEVSRRPTTASRHAATNH
jgi:transmembrane sensor